MDNNTTVRIFDKLDDISDRLARVETQIEQNYTQNQTDHTNMSSIIAELKEDIDELKDAHDEQQSVLDKRAGAHQVYGGIWGLVLAGIGGGGMVAIGGLLGKMIGIFGG